MCQSFPKWPFYFIVTPWGWCATSGIHPCMCSTSPSAFWNWMYWYWSADTRWSLWNDLRNTDTLWGPSTTMLCPRLSMRRACSETGLRVASDVSVKWRDVTQLLVKYKPVGLVDSPSLHLWLSWTYCTVFSPLIYAMMLRVKDSTGHH